MMTDRTAPAQMTRRDWLAIHAPEPGPDTMARLVGPAPDWHTDEFDAWRLRAIAKWSYLYADAMIAAGERS
jgi:hypothetical protein